MLTQPPSVNGFLFHPVRREYRFAWPGSLVNPEFSPMKFKPTLKRIKFGGLAAVELLTTELRWSS